METSDSRNVRSTVGSGIEIQLQGSGVRTEYKDDEKPTERTTGFSVQQTVQEGDDELKRIIEESRSRRKRMKEEMFSSS